MCLCSDSGMVHDDESADQPRVARLTAHRRRRRRRAVCEIATDDEGTPDQCRMAHPAGGEACEPFQKLKQSGVSTATRERD